MIEIIPLIENTCRSGKHLYSEHGLSLYIRHNDKQYLLDTGSTGKFLSNAERLGIDLKYLDGVVISHNHSDHIGGLPALLDYNKEVKVYIKGSARSKFFYKVSLWKKYIGEPRDLFVKYADRFIFMEDKLSISGNMHLLSDTMHDPAYLCKDTHLLELRNGKYLPDMFAHELFIVIEEDDYLVVLSSCSHNGIVNIERSVQQFFPGKPIKNIVGGFHMMRMINRHALNCSHEYVKEIAGLLSMVCMGKIYTCHCTGRKAFGIMQQVLGEDIAYLSTGEQLVIL